jgi:hypothetical protein
VTLKFMMAWLAGDPALGRRFLREAEVAGRLEHPGIFPDYALGHDERANRATQCA